jgi:hypothetical protein
MEKKGDLLNQLAIISDLIEKVNLNVTNGLNFPSCGNLKSNVAMSLNVPT